MRLIRIIIPLANAMAVGYLAGARWPSDTGRGAAIVIIVTAAFFAWRTR